MYGDASDFYALADRLEAAPVAIRRQTAEDVSDWAGTVEPVAREHAPERTGELRDGIHASAGGLLGELVSDAAYSLFVEEGTSDTAPQPYMRPAVEQTLPDFERSFSETPGRFL